MGAIASRSQYQYDKASAVTLRADDAGAITSTTAETAISLSELNAAWWANFEIPHGKFVVAFNIKAGFFNGDASWDDETYSLSLLVDDVVAMNNSPVTIDTFVPVARGIYTRVIDSKDIPALDPDHSSVGKFLQVKCTIAGGEPTINYTCWIAKSLGA